MADITVHDIEFYFGEIPIEQRPELRCNRENQLDLVKGNLRLDSDRTIEFAGAGGTIRTGELHIDGHMEVGHGMTVFDDTKLEELAISRNLDVGGFSNFNADVSVSGTLKADAIDLGGRPLTISPWQNSPDGIQYSEGKVIIGDGTNKDLLLFNTQRDWKFTASGSGAYTNLDLQTTVDGKHFRVVSMNGANAPLQVHTANDASGNRVYLVQNGGRVGIGTTTPEEHLHINGSIRGNHSGAIRISTGSGYVDVGPKNDGWSHFYTDRSKYYFNKEIRVDSGRIGSYNEDLSLQTSGRARITVKNDTGNVGIGESNPQKSVHIQAGSNNPVIIENGWANNDNAKSLLSILPNNTLIIGGPWGNNLYFYWRDNNGNRYRALVGGSSF